MSNPRRLLDSLLLPFRPARWAIFGYRFAWILPLAGGICAVVYGSAYHRIPVSETHTEQIMIAVPDPQQPPPMMPEGMPGGPPGMQGGPPGNAPFQPPADFGPRMKMVQATKTVKSTSDEWELAVNRAVTVSGIVRNPQGELLRVAEANGGPGFCPS
jgi:hypothetical protein